MARPRKHPLTVVEREIEFERNGEWMRDLIVDRPSLTFKQRIEAARTTLGIGKTAAEQAHARAKALLAEARERNYDAAIDAIWARACEDEETARNRGDLRTANRIRIDTARLLGLGAPDRVEHSGSVGRKVEVNYGDLTDEEIAVLKKIDHPIDD